MKPKKGLITEKKVDTIGDVEEAALNDTSTQKEATDAVAEDEKVTSDESVKSIKRQANASKGKNRWWLKYLITAGVLAVLTVLVAWQQGVFTTTAQKELLGELSTAFFVPGIFAVGFGLLVVCSNGGAFDMLSYGFISLARMFKKDPIDRKYGGYYEYSKQRRKKKRSFWYLVIVGAVFVVVGGGLLIGFNLV